MQSFLHNIPVRKQTALKSAAKALQAIKALLYSFAFARPNVRFSLKVLKAKSDKGNWTYAPSPKDALTEVASKIVGQDIVSECAPHLITSDDTGDAIGEGWTIEGLLLSRTAGEKPSFLPFPILTLQICPKYAMRSSIFRLMADQ